MSCNSSVHLYQNSDTSLSHENQREFWTHIYTVQVLTFVMVWEFILLNPFFKQIFSQDVILQTTQVRL